MKITLPTLLGVAFITLRICKVIAWPWVWVVAPFWIPAAIALVVLAFTLVCGWIFVKTL